MYHKQKAKSSYNLTIKNIFYTNFKDMIGKEELLQKKMIFQDTCMIDYLAVNNLHQTII